MFNATEFLLAYSQHLLQTKLYSNISHSIGFLLFLPLNFHIKLLGEM